MSPVFAHGQLKLYLLGLLADRPRHGYELIQDLSDRFGGTYRPSPGTVYPRLAKLEEEGFITSEQAERKSVYAITDAGRAHLADHTQELADIEAHLADSVQYRADLMAEDVRGAMAGLRADLAAAAQRTRAEAAEKERAERADAEAQAEKERTVREEARRRLRDADAALTAFRSDIRAALREAATGEAGVSPLAVETVRTVLDQAARSIKSAL